MPDIIYFSEFKTKIKPMPYRLRRIVGINIRNPQLDGHSMHIAELDPRGALIVSGDNGVGKTSFLRLLPLFYGATPTQILRGTGRASMIRYMLPHPSSAVAYEYERQDAQDLRCVVMHARPDEDAPQFYIVRSGYREEFFCDRAGNFVMREDFKAHVEAMGVEVERKLMLHQWRAVVLGERTVSKDGAELRRLAALHSLGPKPLQGLDHIAAAMANERLSFKDLQTIVLERISSAMGDDRQNVREIKRNGRDVAAWLENAQHLSDLKELRSEEKRLTELCTVVATADERMRSIHAAASSQRQSLDDESRSLQARIIVASDDHARRVDEAQKQQTILDEESINAGADFTRASQRLADLIAAEHHFQQIGAPALLIKQEGEANLTSQLSMVRASLDPLLAKSAGLHEQLGQRSQRIQEQASAAVRRLGEQSTAAQQEAARRIRSLTDQESSERASMEAPSAAQSISQDLMALASRKGELKAQMERPQGSSETLDATSKARQRLDEMQSALNRLTREHRDAVSNLTRARDVRTNAQNDLDAATQCVAQLQARIESLQASKTPASGTLLAFLRDGAAMDLSHVARVIDPQLLSRADLDPQVHETDAVTGCRLAVGSLSLDTRNIQDPAWLTTEELDREIERAQQALDIANVALQSAQKNAVDANTAFEQASEQESMAGARAQEADDQRERQLTALRELNRKIEQEKADAVEQSRQQLAQVLEQVEHLEGEQRRHAQAHAQALADLAENFRMQRKLVEEELAQTLERVGAAVSAIEAQCAADLEEIDRQLKDGLSQAGVDPQEVDSLQSQVNVLLEELKVIESNRAKVAAWVEFRDQSLPQKGSLERGKKQAEEAFEVAKTRATDAARSIEELRDTHIANMAAMEGRLQTITKDLSEIGTLLEQLRFYDQPPLTLLPQMAPQDLMATQRETRQQLLSTADEADIVIRKIHSAMTRTPGMVSDWLTEALKGCQPHENEIPHRYTVRRGRLLASWFDREYAEVIAALHREMQGFFALAGGFVSYMDMFDRQVREFNSSLQNALRGITSFESFKKLTVNIRSSVNDLGYIRQLREMSNQPDNQSLTLRGAAGHAARNWELPTQEAMHHMRSLRDLLLREGGIRVNLSDQVRLECGLEINSKAVRIGTEEEFRAVASNGNTALIVAMFLLGFAHMVRRDAPVRITWITDEIGRFDPHNLEAFLSTLDANHVDVISAAPTADPTALRLFDRLAIFSHDGTISTYNNLLEQDQ